jgi:hypothetical protein
MEVRWMENGQTCTLSRRKFFTFRAITVNIFLQICLVPPDHLPIYVNKMDAVMIRQYSLMLHDSMFY